MKIVIILVGFTLLLSKYSGGQENIIYEFGTNGLTDGAGPNGGLIFDSAGNIYGTTIAGGPANSGTVFELSPLQNGTWQETILYSFCPGGIDNGCPDGREPLAGLVMDHEGNLYGTTFQGGAYEFYGTVFELLPSIVPQGSWAEQVLWSFGGGETDGIGPESSLLLDGARNLYGTTLSSLSAGGIVFELSPGANGWTETALHVFCEEQNQGCPDGASPAAGVVFDKAGNLYGTTIYGGQGPGRVGWGLVYELSPTNDGWTENILKVFNSGTGGRTSAGVTFDPQENLYVGLTMGGTPNCGGYVRVNNFAGFRLGGGNGCGPQSNLIYDSGSLFGVTSLGGSNSQGVLFKFNKSGRAVNQTVIYQFCQQANCVDGSRPSGPVTTNNGQIYGAATLGGSNGIGLIFLIPE